MAAVDRGSRNGVTGRCTSPPALRTASLHEGVCPTSMKVDLHRLVRPLSKRDFPGRSPVGSDPEDYIPAVTVVAEMVCMSSGPFAVIVSPACKWLSFTAMWSSVI